MNGMEHEISFCFSDALEMVGIDPKVLKDALDTWTSNEKVNQEFALSFFDLIVANLLEEETDSLEYEES